MMINRTQNHSFNLSDRQKLQSTQIGFLGGFTEQPMTDVHVRDLSLAFDV